MNLNTCCLLNTSKTLRFEGVEKSAFLSDSSILALYWKTWTLSLEQREGSSYSSERSFYYGSNYYNRFFFFFFFSE